MNMTSWVCDENITYISERTEDHFVLSINFPTCFWDLIRVLHQHNDKEIGRIRDDRIDGLYFEKEICENVEEINVVYSAKDEAFACQDDLQTITFTFKAHERQNPNSPILGLEKAFFIK